MLQYTCGVPMLVEYTMKNHVGAVQFSSYYTSFSAEPKNFSLIQTTSYISQSMKLACTYFPVVLSQLQKCRRTCVKFVLRFRFFHMFHRFFGAKPNKRTCTDKLSLLFHPLDVRCGYFGGFGQSCYLWISLLHKDIPQDTCACKHSVQAKYRRLYS